MTEWGIDTLFNPGKRHLDEEKRRLQSTRDEVGDSSGGKRVDLDSGRIVISKKQAAAERATPRAVEDDADNGAENGADNDVTGPTDDATSAAADDPGSDGSPPAS
ncbi:MAG: hypothetical protein QOH56_351 [Pseudonocardiales bacterium]|jgi:hypothetical protein|nr:hypothetical protein [Pseudonocardiales bacterium]